MRRLITPLLDVDEIARLLGVRRCTIYKWACYNRIPYVKIRRRLMFHRPTIEEWVDRANPPRIERKGHRGANGKKR